MSKIDPNLALQATLPVGGPTLADAIERIVNDTGLERTRRRDMASALRSIAKALGRPPEILPASAHWLQRRLEGVHHEQLGVTAKTWRNITSNAISALRHSCGALSATPRSRPWSCWPSHWPARHLLAPRA